MVFKGLLSKGLPAAVISGLGIGKDKRRKRALCRRFQGASRGCVSGRCQRGIHSLYRA